MKRLLATTIAAAALLTSALPALADGYDRHHDHDRGRPGPYAYHHRYYEGQYWHGHRLAWRGNRWGYYRPQNGVRVFINI